MYKRQHVIIYDFIIEADDEIPDGFEDLIMTETDTTDLDRSINYKLDILLYRHMHIHIPSSFNLYCLGVRGMLKIMF